MSKQFIEDSTRNQIAEKLKAAFFHYFRCEPSPIKTITMKSDVNAPFFAAKVGTFATNEGTFVAPLHRR